MTEIREDNFAINLPGEWEQVESAEESSFEYRDKDNTARVVVTLLGVKPMFAIADQRRLLNDYMHHRSTYEKGDSNAVEQLPPISREHEGTFEGMWTGYDRAAERWFQHRALLINGLLADFLYEESGVDMTTFASHAVVILGSATASAE